MKIRFWGVRGSIPTPGPKTVKYGGNTTCIEIRMDNGDLIILDGGSGIYPLAQSLMEQLPLTAHIFITHTHWDHIHGLPFFTPLFLPDNDIKLYGGFDVVTNKGIEHAIAAQLQYSYFPVREAELKARLQYITINIGESINIGDTRVTPTLMNHPVLNLGYRVEQKGKSMFFTGDHEPHYNIFDPADDTYDEYQCLIEEQEQTIIAAMQGVDVLIADSSYTHDEYGAKKGWGHGTFDSSLAMAKKAGADKLFFTHHEPTRNDKMLEREFEKIRRNHPQNDGDPELHLAREGLEIEI